MPPLRPSRRGRPAFTLIELLIVVVVLGVLAALAIPKLSEGRRKTYVATIKHELRNAVTRAERFYADQGSYEGLALSSATPGVALTVLGAGLISYRLQASHVQLEDAVCQLEGGALADDGGKVSGEGGPGLSGPGPSGPSFGATADQVYGGQCR
jgi:prepilin-type N-terminal cleavage/methylation domain-containing protein